MKLQISAGFIVFFIATVANATTYKIRHVLVDQPGVIVETSNPHEILKPGKVFVATFPTGKKCPFTLKQQIGGVLFLSAASCKYVQEITKETVIEGSGGDREKAPAPTPTPAPVADVDEKPAAEAAPASTPAATEAAPSVAKKKPAFRRVGVSIHYSFTNEMLFKEGTSSAASGSSNLETTYKTESAPGIGLSFVEMAPHNWGFMGNLFYEAQRSVSPPNGGTGKVSFLVGEGCLVYRWDSFYMPFGLNYSLPMSSGFDGSGISNGRSFGILIGTGVLINDRSSVEFFLRALAMRLTEAAGAGTTTYENGSLTGLGVGYKYWF